MKINYTLKNKIIFSLLLTLFIVSIQFAYAEPEFSFKFGTSGTDDDELNNPTDVVVDKNGKNIYIVDNNNDRISVFEIDGDFDFIFGTSCDIAVIQDCNDNADGADEDGDGQFNNPLSIVRDALGKFFVVDVGNKRIQVFDDDGEFQFKFGSSNSGVDEYLGSATGVVIQESTREILVSNIETDSISVFDSTGNYMFEFNSFNGNDDFKNPTHMVIDNSNQILYVSDSGNDRIVIFELVTGTTCPSGTDEVVDGVCFVEEFGTTGNEDGEFDDPNGLAYDSVNDLLYVADSDNDRIQVFEMVEGNTCPSGTDEVVDGVCFVEEFGTTGSDNGQFDSPMGIALDESNDLLVVADSDNDRIQVFSLNSGPEVLLPDRPENIKSSPVSPTSIILSWTEPDMAENIPKITGYKIEYKIGTKDYIPVTENTASKTTSFIHQGLDSDETYSYRIYSINSAGTSVVSSTTSTKPAHTTTPTALTAAAISPSQIKLSWLPPSQTFGQSISGYEIKREVIAGVYDTIGNTNAGTTTFVVTNLSTDKTYTYVVSAIVGYGSTQESPTASATPQEDSVNVVGDPITSTVVQMTKSSPPIKLTATVVSPTQINLAWSPPVEDGNTPITGYKIEMKKDDGNYTTLVEDSESTTRTYSHKSLTTNSKYTYRVSAINVMGISDSSNEFAATPRSTNIQISPLGKLNIDEGKLLLFTVKLTDNSVSNVVFSLDKNPPAGAKIISNTGVFSWTPNSSDGGKTYTFDVIAKKDGVEDRETISITVNDVLTSSQPDPVTEPIDEPEELGIASFVDEKKDPQSYVDRYNNEATYKKWFDENFPEYDSIYQAVGLEEPVKLAPFVDEKKDPQSYVDRYNNEATYKKWFDENFPEYDSIYQAVGLEEPVVKEKKFGICGPGTKLVDGVCTIVKKPVVKPWWQFW
ncbi:MAG: fibronectin type III domain-containing protein [Nitrosopumilus sp.]|uniref:fibronectin type III domain-containing protein n=1 Tax=Nitrosopumilus sp. TaxID=2024843 RepID=UPI002470926A|nr:fibronectin type III domain-containing protein [Nitrosopumilus sp.]MDH5431945.1 fibronectin type III domain-containing protein [Nitrosopumilus sp.]